MDVGSRSSSRMPRRKAPTLLIRRLVACFALSRSRHLAHSRQNVKYVPREQCIKYVPRELDTKDVPFKQDTKDESREQDTKDVPSQQDTKDVSREQDTKDVSRQQDTINVPREQDTINVPREQDFPPITLCDAENWSDWSDWYDTGSDSDESDCPRMRRVWSSRSKLEPKMLGNDDSSEDYEDGDSTDEEVSREIQAALANLQHVATDAEAEMTPEEILNRRQAECGGSSLPVYVERGHTLYTYYAELGRLDVVKGAHAWQMTRSGLAEAMVSRPDQPDLYGRTIIYHFVQLDNSSGVQFSLKVWPNIRKGLLSALAACAGAAGHLRVFNALLAPANFPSGYMELNTTLNLDDHCPWEAPHVNNCTLLQLYCLWDKLSMAAVLMQCGASPLARAPAAAGNYAALSCYEICGAVSANPDKALELLWRHWPDQGQLNAMLLRVDTRPNLSKEKRMKFEAKANDCLASLPR